VGGRIPRRTTQYTRANFNISAFKSFPDIAIGHMYNK
jgi:hypothetical protein